MAYEKRVCVLKQIKKGFTADGGSLSGAVYVERLGSELTVTPRLLGIAPVREGRYVLALWLGGSVFVLELKGGAALKVENAPSVKTGFAALLVFLRGDPEPIAFGSCGLAPAGFEELLEAFKTPQKGGRRSPVPTPLPPTELPAPFSPNNVPLAPSVPVPGEEDEEDARPFREQAAARYDDEAIAESDYYTSQGNEDADAQKESGDAKEQNGETAHGNEETVHPFFIAHGALTYYNSVKRRLEEAFLTFEKDERLVSVFPQSEWVKSDGALLGIIYGNGLPKYLCVAVEAMGDPPESMKEHANFVPATPFSDMVGFWVVFQSADTGEYVTVSNS